MSLYKAANSDLDVPTSPFLSWLFFPHLQYHPYHHACARLEEHDHGHASHHNMEQGRGGGFGPHCEPQAVLQDSGKHATGDTHSWLPVIAVLLYSADAPGPISEQDTALVWQTCKMWKQRRFGNRGYRRDMEEKVFRESGEEVDNRGMWVSFEEMQWMWPVITALSTWNFLNCFFSGEKEGLY